MLKSLILFIALLPGVLFAQVPITGKVTSMVNKNPVPDASIFLSSTSIGGKTGSDGTFTLNNVKNGQYDFVISCVGYEAYHQTIMVTGTGINLPNIALMPKVTELREVKITFDQFREQHLRLLKDELLGRTENARSCTITNIDIVNMQYDKATGNLTADTDDFLIIENKALGYHIKYLLKSFKYEPRRGFISYLGSFNFELMKGSKSDEKRWLKKRTEAYLGSSMHFLRSCIAARVTEENFKVLRLIRTPNSERPADSLIKAKLRRFNSIPDGRLFFMDSINYWSAKSRLPAVIQTLVTTPLNIAAYANLTPDKGIYALGYTDCLQISYRNQESYGSVLTFNNPYAYFDSNGIIINPDSILMEGYWASQRLAEMLPVDYELPLSLK